MLVVRLPLGAGPVIGHECRLRDALFRDTEQVVDRSRGVGVAKLAMEQVLSSPVPKQVKLPWSDGEELITREAQVITSLRIGVTDNVG